MRYKFLILSLFLSFHVFSQEKPLPRQFESQKFIRALEKITDDKKKLEFIKTKIFSDTTYFDINTRIYLHNSARDSIKHICKTLILFYYQNEYLRIDLLKYPKLAPYISSLNQRNISKIKILSPYDSAVFFGDDGACGVVQLTIRRNKYYKKIKNVL